MKFAMFAAALSLATAGAAVPAYAQTASLADLGVKAGATVYGPQGNEAGTVEKVDGENVVLNTGTYSATLPGSAFGKSDKGPIVSMTKAQIDAAMAQVLAQADAALDAALVPGAQLRTSDGVMIGTIEKIDEAGLVTVKREAGNFALQSEMFGTDASGLILRLTAQQFAEAMSAATAAPAETTAADSASTEG